MNDLLEFLEMLAIKNTPEVQSFLGNIDSSELVGITKAIANASPHFETMMEAVLQSGLIGLIG